MASRIVRRPTAAEAVRPPFATDSDRPPVRSNPLAAAAPRAPAAAQASVIRRNLSSSAATTTAPAPAAPVARRPSMHSSTNAQQPTQVRRPIVAGRTTPVPQRTSSAAPPRAPTPPAGTRRVSVPMVSRQQQQQQPRQAPSAPLPEQARYPHTVFPIVSGRTQRSLSDAREAAQLRRLPAMEELVEMDFDEMMGFMHQHVLPDHAQMLRQMVQHLAIGAHLHFSMDRTQAMLAGFAPGGDAGFDDATYESLLALDEANVQRGLSEHQWAKVQHLVATSRDTGDCNICLAQVTVGEQLSRLPCKHSYHRDCVKQWLEKNRTCPVCRKEV